MPLELPFCRYISTSTDASRRLPIASSPNRERVAESRGMRSTKPSGARSRSKMSGKRSTSASRRSVTSCRHAMKRNRSPVPGRRGGCASAACATGRSAAPRARGAEGGARSKGPRDGVAEEIRHADGSRPVKRTSGVISVSSVRRTDTPRRSHRRRSPRRLAALRRQAETPARGPAPTFVESHAPRSARAPVADATRRSPVPTTNEYTGRASAPPTV